jgi:predicted membrane channel-forming protein YqfA (hemolysin III family)
MAALTALPKRRQTLGEEIANSVSHGVGLIAGAVAAPGARKRGESPLVRQCRDE